jgi:hypothetical protein
MDLKNHTISLLLNISKALEQAVRDKDQRIHAVYPQVLPTGKEYVIGEDLMDAFGMAFIASTDAYLRLANSLIDFLVAAGKDKLLRRHDRHHCALYYHFGLDHYHLEDIFHNYETVAFSSYYWDGYRGAALAQTQEEARSFAEEMLSYDNIPTPLAALPSISSLDVYDGVRFIAVSDHVPRDSSLTENADDRQLGILSSDISASIQDRSALIYTLLGGGDDEILLYGTANAYLRLAKGLVDFVLAARSYRKNHAQDLPLLSMDLRSLFDVAYSKYAMDTACLAETQAEFEQACVFFRLNRGT